MVIYIVSSGLLKHWFFNELYFHRKIIYKIRYKKIRIQTVLDVWKEASFCSSRFPVHIIITMEKKFDLLLCDFWSFVLITEKVIWYPKGLLKVVLVFFNNSVMIKT